MEWLLAATCFHCCLFSAPCPDGQTPRLLVGACDAQHPAIVWTPEISDIGIYVSPVSWLLAAAFSGHRHRRLVTQAGTLHWRRGGGPAPAPAPGHLAAWHCGTQGSQDDD